MGKQELEILEPSLWRYEWKDKHTQKKNLLHKNTHLGQENSFVLNVQKTLC